MSSPTREREVITLALNAMLGRSKKKIEPEAIRRMEYETFELIFYNLFRLYEPNLCQRKFQYCYPARNRDQKRCFTQATIDLLKSMNLPNVTIIPGHIQALGGRHFRKILNALVVFVLKFEKKKITRRLGITTDINNLSSPDLETDLDECEKLQEELAFKINEHNLVCDQLRKNHQLLHDEIECAEADWDYLCKNLSDEDLPVNKANGSLLFRSLDDKMKQSCKIMKESVANLQSLSKVINSVDLTKFNHQPTELQQNEFLDIYKKIRKNLRFSIDGTQTESTIKNINSKLDEFERQMDSLSIKLDEEISETRKNLLKTPEISSRVSWFKDNIPWIDLPSIEDARSDNFRPKFADLKDILDKYCTSEGDDTDIDDVLRMFCSDSDAKIR